MFEKKDALPGPEPKPAINYRNVLTGPGQSHTQVARAIVGALISMNEEGEIFRHEVIKKSVEVGSRLWIGIFHDHKTATRVLDEHSDRAILNFRVGQKLANLGGEFVGAFTLGLDAQSVVINGHFF